MSKERVLEHLTYFPALEDTITTIYPEFSKERKDKKMSLLKGLFISFRVWDSPDRKKYRDSRGEEYVTKEDNQVVVPNQELRLLGTSQKSFNDMLKKYPLLVDVGNHWSYAKKEARRYEMQPEFFEIMIDYISNPTTQMYAAYKEEGCKPVTCLAQYIPQRILDMKIADHKTEAKINTAPLRSVINLLAFEGEEGYDIVRYGKIVKQAECRGGMLRQDYKRIKTQRLTVMGNTSLQNIPKGLRREMFEGAYEVDMVNAHYRIASHYIDNAAIEQYAYSSWMVRNIIADDLGVEDESFIKPTLLALLFGCSRNPEEGKFLASKLGKDLAKAFVKNHYVAQIIEGIDLLVYDLHSKGVLQKYRRKGKALGEAQLLSHFLQEEESKIMDACIEFDKNIYLCLYDGFVTPTDVDIEALQSYVSDKTGYDIEFSKDKLKGDSK